MTTHASRAACLPAPQSGVFSILSCVYVAEFNSAALAGPLAKVVKQL